MCIRDSLLLDTQNISITNSRTSSNSSFGLLAVSVNDCFFGNNRILANEAVGLILDNSQRILMQSNEINNNSGIGAYFSPSTSDNAAVDNSYQNNAFGLGLIDDGNNFVDE